MAADSELRIVVYKLAHVVNAALAELAVLADGIAKGQVGDESVKPFDDLAEQMRGLVAAFPPVETLGLGEKGILH
ncbi:MAG TPA: hypothetical protein VFA88_10740 [Gaiellaceae bacterium]|nr:hypothetical protein [Gaiellaceae bacterium]